MGLTLYTHPQSGHGYRVELLLAFLNLEYELRDTNLAARDHRTAEFLALNPSGQIPVLTDGDFVVTQANAILVYLARRENALEWLPLDAHTLAAVEAWMSRASGELAFGISVARTILAFGWPGDLTGAQKLGVKLLKFMNLHLTNRPYLVADRPMICDLALYSYSALSPEAGISLHHFPHVTDWIARIEQLPRFVPLRRSASR
jgi:glutathione S-transferase